MNEDDTFKALKRTPFAQLDGVLDNVSSDTFESIIESIETRRQFLKTHGWTLEEFEIETRKFYVKD